METPWTVACEAPPSMGFSRQEYWSGLSFPPPGDLPDPGIKPKSLKAPALQAGSLPLSHQGIEHSINARKGYSKAHHSFLFQSSDSQSCNPTEALKVE